MIKSYDELTKLAALKLQALAVDWAIDARNMGLSDLGIDLYVTYKILRVSNDLSVAEVARRSGLSYKMTERADRLESKPTIDTLFALLSAVGGSVRVVIDGADGVWYDSNDRAASWKSLMIPDNT